MGRCSNIEETTYQRQAFEIYYSLGPNRSLEKLREKLIELKSSVKFGESSVKIPSLRTLEKWSKKFNWQLRVQQKDIELSEEISKKTNEDIIETKAKYRSLIKAILNRLIESLEEYRRKGETLEIKSMKDIKEISYIVDTLVRLDMDLVGESLEEPVQIIITSDMLPSDDED